MRITFASNAPWTCSGYGNQTRTWLPRLRSLGHDVACIAYFGLESGMIEWEGIRCYPRFVHPFAEDVMVAHAGHFGSDITITLVDLWVHKPEAWRGRLRWCPWIPVDTEPLAPEVRDRARHAWFPMTFSQHGLRACEDAGIPARYVPLGIDTTKYLPRDRSEARRLLGISDDRYVVGMVAANKGFPSRKALPQCLDAFAEFQKLHPDALLYLHITQGSRGETGGPDLHAIARQLDISAHVRFGDPFFIHLGYDDEFMARLYSAFDVLLMPSLGEGFGLPIVEAQACGCPVIVGGWTSMPELCFGGWVVDRRDAEPLWTPALAWQYVPHRAALVTCLEEAWRHAGETDLKRRCREGALDFDADRVLERHFRPALAEIAARLASEPGPIRVS